MQEIWLPDLGWDDKLSTELCQRWNSVLQSYSVLDQVRIPRWVSFRPELRVEHHGFCDASQKTYGAAIYVRVEMGHKTMMHLLTAKTRVAPVKTVSLPRLELCGALFCPRWPKPSFLICRGWNLKTPLLDRFHDCASMVSQTSESLDNVRFQQGVTNCFFRWQCR